MILPTIEDFERAGCALSFPSVVFRAIVKLTGDPCRTGCAYFEGGACQAFRTLFPGVTVPRVKRRRGRNNEDRMGYVKPSKRSFRW